MLLASYVAALGFAIAAIYTGSHAACSNSINAGAWLIATGSLEAIQLAAMAIGVVAQRMRASETPLGPLVGIDLCYLPLRLVLIGLGFAALDCDALRIAVGVMLGFQSLALARSAVLCAAVAIAAIVQSADD